MYLKCFLACKLLLSCTTNQKTQIFGQAGQKNGLVGELFVKFSKIVLKSFIYNKKLISCHSRQFKILKNNFSHCPKYTSSF